MNFDNQQEKTAYCVNFFNSTLEEQVKIIEQVKQSHPGHTIIAELERKYGKELVETGGLKVYTTIDPRLQKIANEAIAENAEKHEKNLNVKNAALVALDPKTRQVLAMVGSRDFNNDQIDGQVNITRRERQPGSSFKPIVYAAAFNNRISPASVVFDVPTNIGSDQPKNFDGKFMGPISMRTALGKSRNIPAAKAYFVGGEDSGIMHLAKKMGVKFKVENKYYGWPLSLGSADTSLISMVNAYSAFADRGIYKEPVTILKVVTSDGQVLEEWKDTEGEQALDPQVAYLISSILSDPVASIGPNLQVNGQVVAAKTGTSTESDRVTPKDLLAIGYSTKIAAGVWAGNNDNAKHGKLAKSAEAYSVSAPIWKKFMTEALKDNPKEDFPIPEGIVKKQVNKLTGKLPTENTPKDQIIEDYFASFAVPTEIDNTFSSEPNLIIPESINQSCKNNELQVRQIRQITDLDPTRESWNKDAQEWLNANPDYLSQNSGNGCEPAEDNAEALITLTNLTEEELKISLPDQNSIDLEFEAKGNNQIDSIAIYLNSNLREFSKDSKIKTTLKFPKNSKANNFNIIVRAQESDGRVTIRTFSIKSI